MMTQSICAALYCALLVMLAAFYVVLAENDSGSASTPLRDSNEPSKSDSQIRGKRMINILPPATEDGVYHSDRLNNLVGMAKDLEGDLENSQESEYVPLDKKGSSFVRIGKIYPMNRFIRIGRLYSEPNSEDSKISDNLADNKRASQFVRIGKAPSSFVRIGKSQSDDNNADFDKRASSFLRIGRLSQPFYDPLDNTLNRLKRATEFARVLRGPSSFVRIGKAPSNFVRIGKAPSNFVRIGKAPSNFVRIGKAPSNFVRIGKAPSSFVRIGRAPSSFVRIGKAPSNFVRIGKAPSSFVRIGKSDAGVDYAEIPEYSEKRASSFVRIGKSDLSDNGLKQFDSSIEGTESLEEDKRASSFVRIGKSELTDGNSESKRASSFVRIGKSEPSNDAITDLEKKDSSYVLFGKSSSSGIGDSSPSSPTDQSSTSLESVKDGNPATSDDSIKIATRGSAFVRIGKIPSSAFVRIGKNTDLLMDQDDYNRRSRGSQSSFVRIGK